MIEAVVYQWLIWIWFAVAAVTAASLFVVTAPYGRHDRGGWGPKIPSWVGWVLMEAPSPLAMIACFAIHPPLRPGAWVFFGLWLTHYVNRAFIYPLRNPGGHKPMPFSVCLMAIFFNLVNGYLNGRGFTLFGPQYGWDWFTAPRTLLGLGMWATGFFINLQSDQILFNLRKPGETGYKIPRGGMYRFVSCPNYFGEILEWTGFALAAWAPAAWTFAVWTAANLLPRAWSHHRWYRQKFDDYPKTRRALIPFLF